MNKFLFFLSLLFFALACSDNNTIVTEDPTNEQDVDKKSIVIKLTDAPILIDAVNINIIGLELIADDEIFPMDTDVGMINLLDFQNGVELLLADENLDVDCLQSLKILLGDGNHVIEDGEVFPLIFPTSAQAGLKISIDRCLDEFDYADMLIDFDAEKSIHLNDQGEYIMRPVLRLVRFNDEILNTDEIDLDDEVLREYLDSISDIYPDYEIGEIEKATLCFLDYGLIQIEMRNNNGFFYLLIDHDGNIVFEKHQLRDADIDPNLIKAIEQEIDDPEIETAFILSSAIRKIFEVHVEAPGLTTVDETQVLYFNESYNLICKGDPFLDDGNDDQMIDLDAATIDRILSDYPGFKFEGAKRLAFCFYDIGLIEITMYHETSDELKVVYLNADFDFQFEASKVLLEELDAQLKIAIEQTYPSINDVDDQVNVYQSTTLLIYGVNISLDGSDKEIIAYFSADFRFICEE